MSTAVLFVFLMSDLHLFLTYAIFSLRRKIFHFIYFYFSAFQVYSTNSQIFISVTYHVSRKIWKTKKDKIETLHIV